MLKLQNETKCHNINFVTPEHVVPQVIESIALAVEGGLQVPIVYNTSSYDSLRSLELLDGLVDIYMPDFKVCRMIVILILFDFQFISSGGRIRARGCARRETTRS